MSPFPAPLPNLPPSLPSPCATSTLSNGAPPAIPKPDRSPSNDPRAVPSPSRVLTAMP
ncbi:glycoside hydrolase, partial [Akkermansia muciniphila]